MSARRHGRVHAHAHQGLHRGRPAHGTGRDEVTLSAGARRRRQPQHREPSDVERPSRRWLPMQVDQVSNHRQSCPGSVVPLLHVPASQRGAGCGLSHVRGVAGRLPRRTADGLRVVTGITSRFLSLLRHSDQFYRRIISGLIDITIGSLDDPGQVPPTLHYWESERLPWCTLPINCLAIRGSLPPKAFTKVPG